ncbi:MAG: hypothetical protein AB7V77_00810 [Candidatus Woesearchaeota archaeon]
MSLDCLLSEEIILSDEEKEILRKAKSEFPTDFNNLKETYSNLTNILTRFPKANSLMSISEIELITRVAIKFHIKSKPFKPEQIRTLIDYYDVGILKTENEISQKNQFLVNMNKKTNFETERLDFYLRLYSKNNLNIIGFEDREYFEEILESEFKKILVNWTDLLKCNTLESFPGLEKISHMIKYTKPEIFLKLDDYFTKYLEKELTEKPDYLKAGISNALGTIYRNKTLTIKEKIGKEKIAQKWYDYKKEALKYFEKRDLEKYPILLKQRNLCLLSMGDAKYSLFFAHVCRNRDLNVIKKDVTKMRKYYSAYEQNTKEVTEKMKEHYLSTQNYLNAQNKYAKQQDYKNEKKKRLKKDGEKRNKYFKMEKHSWKKLYRID